MALSLMYSSISTWVSLIIFLGLIGGAIWFIFYKRKVKKYLVDIYVYKNVASSKDPILIFKGTDSLVEKYFGKSEPTGERAIYKLKKLNIEVEIPNKDVIYIVGKKNKIDLLMINAFLYVPFMKKFKQGEVIAELMDHDIDMFRLASIDNRDKVYSDTKTFAEKMLPMMGLFLLIILVIIVGYLSFDFATKLTSASFGPLQTMGEELLKCR